MGRRRSQVAGQRVESLRRLASQLCLVSWLVVGCLLAAEGELPQTVYVPVCRGLASDHRILASYVWACIARSGSLRQLPELKKARHRSNKLRGLSLKPPFLGKIRAVLTQDAPKGTV